VQLNRGRRGHRRCPQPANPQPSPHRSSIARRRTPMKSASACP